LLLNPTFTLQIKANEKLKWRNLMFKRIRCTKCDRTIRIEGGGKCPYCGLEYTDEELNDAIEADDSPITEEEPAKSEPKGIGALLLNPYLIGTVVLFIVVFIFLEVFKSCSKPSNDVKTVSEGKVDVISMLTGEQDKARKDQQETYMLENERLARGDLRQIQKLLELHYDKYGNYPRTLSPNLDEINQLGAVEPLLKRFVDNKILSYKEFISADGKTYQFTLQAMVKLNNRLISIEGKRDKQGEKGNMDASEKKDETPDTTKAGNESTSDQQAPATKKAEETKQDVKPDEDKVDSTTKDKVNTEKKRTYYQRTHGRSSP
jgi:hypothetical protein